MPGYILSVVTGLLTLLIVILSVMVFVLCVSVAKSYVDFCLQSMK